MTKEKKYKRISWITTAAVQVVLLLLFYFLIAWKEPFPPLPSYGIELSLGFEEAGSGSPSNRPVAKEPVAKPTPVEESQPTEENAPKEAVAPEGASEPKSSEAPEPVDETPVEEAPISSQPSPDRVEEVKPKASTDTPTKPDTKPQPNSESKKTTPAKEEPVEEEPALNPAASMPAKADSKTTGNGEDKVEGTKGKEEGKIDGRAIMGEQGVSGGANLSMTGWVWDFKPEPKDDSNESGKIVFKITVDSEGYLIGIETISSTVSPVVERYYKQAVERLTFTQTTNSPAPATSSGTITFIIKSN